MQTYTIKPNSAEEFYTAFPAHATKITGEPSYDDLRQLRTVIYQNAASVNSSLGGGNHGHLGMIMDAPTYATLTATPWQDPPEPPVDLQLPNNPTGFQIAEAHRLHNQELKVRREFQNLDRALTRIIMESVDELYLKPFYQPYIGLLGKSTKEILDALIASYGYILPQELERNYEQLAKPYDATSEPLQVLIERFENTRTFANDGNLPITDAQLINSGVVALKNTGVLDRYIDQWTDKPMAERHTWLQFKNHFQPRVLEYQKGRRGAGAAPQNHFGLQALTSYTSQGSTSDTSTMSTGTVQDAWNQANHAAMANMAATQQTELLKQLADMQERFATLVASTQAGQNAATARTPVRRNGNNRNSNTNRPEANKDPNGYCWTHGYNVAHGHTSESCRNRADGHKTQATARSNNMGGSQANKPT